MSSHKRRSVFTSKEEDLYPSIFLHDQVLIGGYDNPLGAGLNLYNFSKENMIDPLDVLLMIKDGVITPIIETNWGQEFKVELEYYFQIINATNKTKFQEKCQKLYFALEDVLSGIPEIDSFFMTHPELFMPYDFHPKSKDASNFYDAISKDGDLREFLVEFMNPEAEYAMKSIWIDPLREWQIISGQFDIEVERIRKLLISKFGRKMYYFIDQFVEDFRICQIFRTSVIDDLLPEEFVTEIFNRMGLEYQKEISPKLADAGLAQRKITKAFGCVLKKDFLRLPYPISYDAVRKFRKSKAHINLNEWLTNVVETYEHDRSKFQSIPRYIVDELDQLSLEIQNEISKKSFPATVAISGFTAYLTSIFTNPYIGVVSALTSFVPFNYILSKIFENYSPYNFTTYFTRWRRPALRKK